MAKKPIAEDKMAPGHHMGCRYGYDVLPDGKISLAPGLADRMRSLMDEGNGLEQMQRSIALFVSQAFARLSKSQREWWDEVGSDLGVDIISGSGWSFEPMRGTISKPKDDPKPASE